MTADLSQVAAVLAEHAAWDAIEEGFGYTIGWRCLGKDCDAILDGAEDGREPEEWFGAHQADMLAAAGLLPGDEQFAISLRPDHVGPPWDDLDAARERVAEMGVGRVMRRFGPSAWRPADEGSES